MKDEALKTAPELSKAQAAVSYVLQRIRVDMDLRHLMIGTEAFERLCAAEAERLGTTEEAVDAQYSQPAEHCRSVMPRLVAWKKRLDQIESFAEEHYGRHVANDSVFETIARIARGA